MYLKSRRALQCVRSVACVLGMAGTVMGWGQATLTATVTMTAAGTAGEIAVTARGESPSDFDYVSGGTCAVGTTYAVGDTCTVQYNYYSRFPGVEYGGIFVATSANAVLGNTYLSGSGTMPMVNWGMVPSSLIGSGWSKPCGTAVDGNRNVFVSDMTANTVTEFFTSTSYSTSKTIGSGFNGPCGLAVDGSGNLFVGDVGNHLVKKYFAADSYVTEQTLDIPSLYPYSLAVDGSGDVFIAGGATVNEVKAVNGVIPSSPSFLTLVSGAHEPIGVAVDAAGDVYYTDYYTSPGVYEIPSGGTNSVKLLASSDPTSLTIDSMGDLYFADDSAGTVSKIFAVNGTIPSSPAVQVMASGLSMPYGIAVEMNGSLIYGEMDGKEVHYAGVGDDAQLVRFATTPVGETSSDSPRAITLINAGNAPLVFWSVGGEPSQWLSFPEFTMGSTTCPLIPAGSTSTQQLAAGASCTTDVSFTPDETGNNPGALTITNNNLNEGEAVGFGEEQILLDGLGTAVNAPTVTSVSPASGPVVGGTTVTVTGTNFTGASVVKFGLLAATSFVVNNATSITAVSPAGTGSVDVTVTTPNGTSATSVADVFTYTVPTQTQTVTFPQPAGGYVATSVLLAATASSGLPVSYSVVSGPATVSGSVLTYTGTGNVVVEADQAGDATYAAAPPVQSPPIKTSLLQERVGSASDTVTTVVTFGSAGTLGSVAVLTQGATGLDFAQVTGGSCAIGTTYAVGQNCTVEFNFTPTRPGQRFGGIVLSTSAGAMLANSYVYGVGVGPQIGWLPGTQTHLGNGLNLPSGVAVDGSSNVYVSEYGGGLAEIAVGGAQRTIGSFGLTGDVAVDGSGNLFVVDDTSVYEVMAVNGVIPASPTIVTLATGFIQLNGIAVDATGNVFVANGSGSAPDGAVYELGAINGMIPASPVKRMLGSGFGVLTGVAVDANGDVFTSDSGNKAVYEIEAVNGGIGTVPVIRALGGTLTLPSNVGLDAANDVYVTDAATGEVSEYMAVNGNVPVNPVIRTVGTGIIEPQGMVVDSNGNIFIADMGIAQVVKLDYADPPSLTFATTVVGSVSSDSPQTVTMSNDGNASLMFTAPVSITPGFTIGSGSTCSQFMPGSVPALLLNMGDSCTEQISFTPVSFGVDSGTITVADNAVGLIQTVRLNGVGMEGSMSEMSAFPTTAYAGQTVTLAATVSYTTGMPLPTGTVSFYSGTTLLGTGTLMNDVAVAETTALPVGADSLTCVYSGDSLYVGSRCAPVTETVQLLPTALTMTQNPNPAYALSPVTFTAHLTIHGQPAGAGYAVPWVFNGDFLVGQQTSGTAVTDATGAAMFVFAPGFFAETHSVLVGFNATATMASSNATAPINILKNNTSMTLIASPSPGYQNQPENLVATLANTTSGAPPAEGSVTFTDVTNGSVPLGTVGPSGLAGTNLASAMLVTSGLAPGLHTIQAVFTGSLDFNAASVATVQVTILPQDFTINANPPSITIQTEHHASMPLTLTSIGGFTADISLSCAGSVPKWVTCSFASQPVFLGITAGPGVTVSPTASATVPATLTIDTDALLDYKSETRGVSSRVVLAGLLPVMLLGFVRRRKLRGLVVVAIVSVMAMAMTACSGQYPAHTAPGTYTITVQATGTAVGASVPTTHTLDVTLVVTP